MTERAYQCLIALEVHTMPNTESFQICLLEPASTCVRQRDMFFVVVCVYMWMNIYVDMHTCVHVSISKYYMYACTYIHTHLYSYGCIYMNTKLVMFADIHTSIHLALFCMCLHSDLENIHTYFQTL